MQNNRADLRYSICLFQRLTLPSTTARKRNPACATNRHSPPRSRYSSSWTGREVGTSVVYADDMRYRNQSWQRSEVHSHNRVPRGASSSPGAVCRCPRAVVPGQPAASSASKYLHSRPPSHLRWRTKARGRRLCQPVRSTTIPAIRKPSKRPVPLNVIDAQAFAAPQAQESGLQRW